MPVLTTLLIFSAGTTASVLWSRAKKKPKLLPWNRRNRQSLISDEAPLEPTSKVDGELVLDNGSDDDNVLAKATPLAVSGLACAVAGSFINPALALPAIFISGILATPLAKSGWQKFRQSRRLSELLDSSLILILALINQVVAGSVILVSISLSKKVLSKTYDQSRKNLNGILNTLPKQVWVLKDGVEMEIDYWDITTGDTLIVNSNDMISVDGKVVRGEGLVDQMSLTGESTPAEKTPGDDAYAGTVLVSGRLLIEVEKSGKHTHAGEVSKMILNAADQRMEVQERGEQVVEKSIRALLPLSALVAVVSGLPRALGVYLVSPGYTMRVLSPLALLQSLQDATSEGILIKDGRSLELLQNIDTVIFDKTGTLTDGSLKVADVISVSGMDQDTILSVAASAERSQTHPIARAIVGEASDRGIEFQPLQESQYIVARGVSATVAGRQVKIGSARFLQDEGFVLTPETHKQIRTFGENGCIVILVATEQRIEGLIALSQVLRPEAFATIAAIRERGIETMIISGDAEAATQHVASELGVDSFHAETLPGDKLKIIEKMQREGHKVCFIGDGINDAAALKQSNVSMSIRGSSTIAIDTAQIVLVNANLSLIDQLFGIAGNYRDVTRFSSRLSIGLPLLALPAALTGTGGILLVVAAHNISTWGGLWRILHQKQPTAKPVIGDSLEHAPTSTLLPRNSPARE